MKTLGQNLKKLNFKKVLCGPVIIHDQWDVPSGFGDRTFFFKAPNTKKIKAEYLRYKKSGVEIKPIG